MDTTRLDLNLLLTLEALLAEQNVTKAAARLNLSQPAVSAQLNRLRDMFDDPLLVPARRGMTPTVKALELLAPLRESLDQLRRTLQSHKDFYPERATLTLAIACTDYIQAAVVMPLVLALRQTAPGVRIAARHYDPAQLEQQLANGDVDIAIITPGSHHAHLRTRHLFNETYVLIGRQGHPTLKNNLTMQDFAQLEHVIVSPSGGSFSTPIDDILAAFGHQRKVVMSAASFFFVPEIVLISDFVALVPRRLLQGQPARLSVVNVPWLTEQFNVSLVWHERSHGHAGHRWLRNLIVELNGHKNSRENAP
ncbi:LysR family transcriptional regulator [Chania multitudinisentens RB-25]|uniref:LysR family transcriptional regulator n=1 Tax=Chania multitudinisentens RB-25 TaxID=1441930 RepID=W0L9F6_9GAMM|nr:LysR family transcriptional regulator [Chania multitudinisentens]AHG19019.1 LysR family transcriptional regulator [Chania multitudinisentens RB-25]